MCPVGPSYPPTALWLAWQTRRIYYRPTLSIGQIPYSFLSTLRPARACPYPLEEVAHHRYPASAFFESIKSFGPARATCTSTTGLLPNIFPIQVL